MNSTLPAIGDGTQPSSLIGLILIVSMQVLHVLLDAFKSRHKLALRRQAQDATAGVTVNITPPRNQRTRRTSSGSPPKALMPTA